MTNLSPIRLKILECVVVYYTLTRMQLQDLCMPPGKDVDGRRMRKHLMALRREHLICQTQGQVVFPHRNGAPSPVYFPSRKGCELLAAETGQERFLHACTLTPNWQNLPHWVKIADFRIHLDKAVSRQSEVAVENCLTEWTIANPEEKAPEKRYSLFTLLRESPRLVCAPDASFLVRYQGFLRGVLVEIDRLTSGIKQIAASKTPGFAYMAEHNSHLRLFPGLTPRSPAVGDAEGRRDKKKMPFTVLHVSPTPARRDQVRAAVRPKPWSELWKFAAWSDLTPESLLHDPILRDIDGEAVPLVRRLEETPAGPEGGRMGAAAAPECVL
jgi:hypothetical protein